MEHHSFTWIESKSLARVPTLYINIPALPVIHPKISSHSQAKQGGDYVFSSHQLWGWILIGGVLG
jgi:hypothetical protein